MTDRDKTKQQLISELEELREQVATLEADQRRYRTIIDTVPLAIGEINREGVIVFANAATEKLFGYPPEELVGKRAGGGIEPAAARDAFRAWFHHTMSEQPPPSPVFAHQLNKNGDEINVRGDWNYLRNEQGEVIGQVTVVADITESKRAQEALAERESRLLEAQEVARLGFYVLDIAQGRWTSSPVLDRIFDIPGDYARTTQGWGELVHPEERQQMLDYFLHEVVGEKKPFDREYRIVRHGDQQVRWVHGLGRLEFDAFGRPVSMLGTIQDITERKRAEEALQKAHGELEQRVEERTAELREANERLRASEERYELAVRGAGVGIWDWDIRSGTVYYSPRWKMLFGYDESDIGDGVEDWVRLLHPDERDWILKFQDEFLAGTSPAVAVEYRLRHKDGSYRWITAHAVVVRDEQGRASRLVGSHGDITDRRQAGRSRGAGTAVALAHAPGQRPRTADHLLRDPRRAGPVSRRRGDAVPGIRRAARAQPGRGEKSLRRRHATRQPGLFRGAPPDQRSSPAGDRRNRAGDGDLAPGSRTTAAWRPEDRVRQQRAIRPPAADLGERHLPYDPGGVDQCLQAQPEPKVKSA